MPVMRSIACHTPSCRRSVMYAAGPGNPKVVARDYINCAEVDLDGAPAWLQLDRTRAAFGHDRPRMRAVRDASGDPVVGEGGAPVRRDSTVYYEHFVIAPDPRDDVGVEQVRAVACEWVRREFPGFEAVVGCHGDGAVPHAHAIVNNTRLSDGALIKDVTRGAHWARDAWRSLQDIARSHGLSCFGGDAAGVAESSAETDPREPRRREPGRPDARCKEVRSIADGGRYSWVEDVRARCEFALRVSATTGLYVDALGAVGVEVGESARGGWKYSMTGGEGRRISAARLGSRWTELGVAERLRSDRRSGRLKPSGKSRDTLLATARSLIGIGATRVDYMGTVDTRSADALGRLGDLTGMLDLLDVLDVASGAELRSALESDEWTSRERELLGMADELGFLPQQRPHDLGRRATAHAEDGDDGTPEAMPACPLPADSHGLPEPTGPENTPSASARYVARGGWR